MEYTIEQIAKVEKMAGIFMTIKDMAAILEVDENQLREDINRPGTDIGAKYHKAKSTAKAYIQNANVKNAMLGAPAAMERVKAYMDDMDDDE